MIYRIAIDARFLSCVNLVGILQVEKATIFFLPAHVLTSYGYLRVFGN